MKFNDQLADAIYTSDMEKLGENALQAMQNTIYQNGGVGTVTGYYDDDLTILSVSDLLLHNLNHSYASLMERTKGSLKNLFYGENVSFLEPERFSQFFGALSSDPGRRGGAGPHSRWGTGLCALL